MDRIECTWCKEQNTSDRTDCVKCGAPLDVRDRIEAPASTDGSVRHPADFFASGERVTGVLTSFLPSRNTPRSLGASYSRQHPPLANPDLIDAPLYVLEVELQFPGMAPVTRKMPQPVPPSQVPDIAKGLKLVCVVDPADPAHRKFIVDWDDTARLAPGTDTRRRRWGR
jgi:hypothetical protein